MRPRFFLSGALAIILAALMWGWGPARAGAEEAGGNLSLNQAINIALKEHPAVKQFRENMAASREGIGIAKSAYFPQANFVGSYYYGNAFATSLRPQTSTGAVGASSSAGLSVPAGNFYFYQFQANQLLYDFGKTPGTVAESRANFKGSEQDYFGTRQQVVLDLRTAYFGYLAARRGMKVQEETVRQNQELTKQAQGFYQTGLKAKIDVTKAEANLYQAEAESSSRAKTTWPWPRSA